MDKKESHLSVIAKITGFMLIAGLKYMYKLTHGFKSDLRIDLVNASGNSMWEKDRGFRIVDPPFYAFNIDGWTSSSN